MLRISATGRRLFKLDSLRILTAMAARHGMVAHVLDAFVGSDIDKPNYMGILEGLQDFNPEARANSVVLELEILLIA